MATSIIDGKDYASRLRDKLKIAVNDLKEKHKIVPGLAVVLVGNECAYMIEYIYIYVYIYICI